MINPSKDLLAARRDIAKYKGYVLSEQPPAHLGKTYQLSDVQWMEAYAVWISDVVRACETAKLLHVLWSFEIHSSRVRVRNSFIKWRTYQSSLRSSPWSAKQRQTQEGSGARSSTRQASRRSGRRAADRCAVKLSPRLSIQTLAMHAKARERFISKCTDVVKLKQLATDKSKASARAAGKADKLYNQYQCSASSEEGKQAPY